MAFEIIKLTYLLTYTGHRPLVPSCAASSIFLQPYLKPTVHISVSRSLFHPFQTEVTRSHRHYEDTTLHGVPVCFPASTGSDFTTYIIIIIIIIITTLFQSQSNRYKKNNRYISYIQNRCWHAGQNNQSLTTRFSTGISCQHKRC